MVDSRNFKMVTKQISDYWINEIKKQFNEAQITYDNGILKEAIIKDIHIIRYTAIVNSLQYYKKIAYLEEAATTSESITKDKSSGSKTSILFD